MYGIPIGLRDILVDGMILKKKIENNIRKIFSKYNYFEIATPTFEYYDVLSSESGEIINREMIKFFDKERRIISLRPEMTTPIARLVAQRMRNYELPLRLSYIQNVFREEPTQRGQQREFWQAGAELIGKNDSNADAEIISILIESMLTSGLKDFQINTGQIDYFKATIDSKFIPDNVKKEITKSMLNGDFVKLIKLCEQIKDKKIRKQIIDISANPYDLLEKANEKELNDRQIKALNNLREVINILRKNGFDKYIIADLGIIRNFDYYTGIIFEGYTSNFGFPVCGGGRYNNLLGEFGYDQPAVGFQLGIERFQIALSDKPKSKNNQPVLRIAICKGELLEPTINILEKAGLKINLLKKATRDGRKLKIKEQDGYEYILCRPTDVPVYVEYGAADIGIVGKDVLLESEKNVFELLDFGFGKCRIILAEPKNNTNKKDTKNIQQIRVATKYPKITENYFREAQTQVEIVKLHGNIELSPSVGLAEQIVDLTSTGKTLEANNLIVVDEIADCTTRLISNKVSQRLKYRNIMNLTKKLQNIVGG